MQDFHTQIKTIGPNGQLSLGKGLAGAIVSIEQIDEGTWVVKKGQFIPDSEKWLHKKQELAKLDRALAWAEKNEPIDNFNEMIRKAEHAHKNRHE